MVEDGRFKTPQDASRAVDEVLADVETTISSLVEGRGEERITGRHLDFVPTHISGFYVTVATGDEAPDMLRSEVELHAKEVRIYYLRNQFIKRLQILQKPLRESLVKRAIANDRLRGGFDEIVGGEVQLNPNSEIDLSLLQESLRERIGEYVHQKTVISFELDPETDDVEEIQKAVKGILKRRDKDPKLVKKEDTLRIDREELRAAVRRGDITLISGTITIPDDPSEWRAVPNTVVSVAGVVKAISLAAERLGLNNPQPETPKK